MVERKIKKDGIEYRLRCYFRKGKYLFKIHKRQIGKRIWFSLDDTEIPFMDIRCTPIKEAIKYIPKEILMELAEEEYSKYNPKSLLKF